MASEFFKQKQVSKDNLSRGQEHWEYPAEVKNAPKVTGC